MILKIVFKSAGIIALLTDMVFFGLQRLQGGGAITRDEVVLHAVWAVLAGLLMFGDNMIRWAVQVIHEYRGHDG